MYVSPDVIRALGPVPAVIHAVITAADSGAGTEMTAKQIAAQANVSEKTARRSLKSLVQAGLITSEAIIRDNWQKANRYRITTSNPVVHPRGHGDQTPGQNDQANSINTLIDNSYIEEDIDTYSVTRREYAAVPAALVPEEIPGALPRHQELPWPPASDPMPQRIPGEADFWFQGRQASWLVSYFGSKVLEAKNKDLLAAKKTLRASVPSTRLEAWFPDALALAKKTSLLEAVKVIDWVFDTHQGELPWDPMNPFRYKPCPDPRLAKVTHLKAISDGFDRLSGLMKTSSSIKPRRVTGARTNQPSAGHGAQDVSALVEKFREYRPFPEPTDFVLKNWATTFEIMLGPDGRSLADIEVIIEGLATLGHLIDTMRYRTPYDVRQEFDFLLQQVKAFTVPVVQQNSRPVACIQKCPTETPRASQVAILRASVQDRPGRSDMSNIQERRARYDARARELYGDAAILLTDVV